MAGQGGRSRELAQAYLHLGIAYLALDQRDKARARFGDALRQDKDLKLRPERYSPKVIAVFEEARRESQKAAAPAARASGGGVKWPLILLGAGGATAGGIALATRGGDQGPAGDVRFTSARFGTPVLVCLDGAQDLVLPLTIMFDATNSTSASVTVSSISVVLIITASPGVPSEVDFASNPAATFGPAAVAARGAATVAVNTFLLCTNGQGDTPRFNEWLARLTISTSAGVFTLETADRLRVNIP